MAKATIAALSGEIKKRKSTWQADETTVWKLPEEEQNRMLGYRADEKELDALGEVIKAANSFQALQADLGLPTIVDWRNHNGNWVTPIKDQQSCGSCVSFATLATIESALRLACRNANMAIDLSEAFQFYCGCGNCCGSGWNFQPSLDFAKNRGVALEANWPYTPGDQPCRATTPIYTRITGWNRILSTVDRKNALASKGPLVAGMAVYADFLAYRSGVYRRTSNTLRGYHAISVIGYNDTEQAWICKNSWGTGWGEAGFFRIGYGQSDIDVRFPFYSVDIACPRPTVDCTRYVPYLVAVIRAARVRPTFRACLRYYVCRIPPPPITCTAYAGVIRNVQQVLRVCPQYRTPFCNAMR